ncbi:MAG TPA: ribonuclease III [Geobacteraceae bacterium]|jgi:ribonuclease-3|nr:ribonuclease III [Geobacteraceae bacterium]
MNDDTNDILAELEDAIGHRFGNRRLLEEALTHRSFLNESGEKGVADNERLEFFGDAVIDFFLSHLLLEKLPASREGELTKIRASLVGEENLAALARGVGLGRYLRLGRGEGKSGGREKRSILADAYEALVAAVYLDGGDAPLRRLVERHFGPLLDGDVPIMIARDNKTEFQELAQALRGAVPRYRHLNPSGPDHERVFTVEVFIGDDCFGTGSGRTKKEAEQSAARAGLERLRGKKTTGIS